ncbi:MAG TPA: hypothetical protein VK255_01890 [Patescibacteria group bacterium]|nr:hypothetical protein [Patescibacteria group bacterium]
MQTNRLVFNLIAGIIRAIINFMEKIKIENHSFSAFSWFAGWLFTIGFLHLAFWQGVLAIVLWPYYIGVAVSNFVAK